MQRLKTHLEHPQRRHLVRAIEVLRAGGLAIYATDTTYGLGCDLFARRSIDRIYEIKGLDPKHPLSFLCADLSDIARYAVVNDRNFKILRRHTPGMYTFILPSTREVPKLVQNQKTRTVGIRIPSSPVCRGLLDQLGHPIITTTVGRAREGADAYTNDPDDIVRDFGRSVDLFLDSGPLEGAPSSIIDLTGDRPEVLRVGSGPVDWVEDA